MAVVIFIGAGSVVAGGVCAETLESVRHESVTLDTTQTHNAQTKERIRCIIAGKID
jgi:hypothetical protein